MSVSRSMSRLPDLEKGRRSLGRPKRNDSLELLQNDDEEEQRRRHQERIMEQQRMNLTSPSTPQEKRAAQGTGVAGLSNAQLTSHYADCIRLSTENKITVKNAFGLHLIDYMSEMIKSKEGTTNFQMASCTLDASTKIYAYRVDCVHAETLKMAGGLGMVDDQKKRKQSKNEEEEAAGSGDDEPKKRKYKPKKGATIEQNLKNITLNPAELEYEMDPLFQKMTMMYDEGGVAGLLTNNLVYSDDYCELILDPSIFPPPLDRSLQKIEEANGTKFNISQFKESLLLTRTRPICPTFASFEFSNNNDLEVEFRCSMDEANKSDYAYDPNDPDAGGRSPSDYNDDLPEDIPMQDDDGDGLTKSSESEFRLGCAPLKTPGSVRPVSLAPESLADMASMLAERPSEYSYFDQNLVATWAGPSHWKIKPPSKCKDASSEVPEKTAQRKRTKRVVPRLTIDPDVEVQIVSSEKTILNKLALQKWSADKVTLPEDLHYDCQRIKRFLIHPLGHQIKVSTPSKAVEAGQDDKYNYNNANDCENFCPSAPDDSSGDEGDRLGDALPDDNPMDDMTFSLTTQGTQQQGTDGVAGTSGLLASFTGDNLVQQPYKIEKLNIAYERTAKKVDVLKVKKTMWSILSQTINSKEESVSDVMPSPMSFAELVTTLPKHVSETTAKNVTIPIAFVSLLHLVNEKNLKITGREDLSDFILEQD